MVNFDKMIKDVENQIDEICKMPADWDGHGALPISQATKNNSLSILSNILKYVKAPEITPNPNGTLSLEWETEHGVSHLEVGQTLMSFYIIPNQGHTIFLDASSDDFIASSSKIGLAIYKNLFQKGSSKELAPETNLRIILF